MEKISKQTQNEVILQHCIYPHREFSYYSAEFRESIDAGLEKDSTIAFLWEKKSEPLMKLGKYEIGLKYLDKAVKYDTAEWLAYRGFMECIFAHEYTLAIEDFKIAKKLFGNSIIMDHSYDFYTALSYLQLNNFERAENLFEMDIKAVENDKGHDWVHHLDLFYLGISKYEQKKYNEAIKIFNLALVKYPKFAEVQYYKSICLKRLCFEEEANILRKHAEINGKNGYTINEDNVAYVRYPYQIMWKYH